MDFEVKTSERMFSDVVQIQLNTRLNGQFTSLQRAHVVIAGFRPKLTGVFLSLKVYFPHELQSESSAIQFRNVMSFLRFWY